MENRTIDQLIHDGGGAIAIANEATRRAEDDPAQRKLSDSAVHKWRKNGVSNHHFQLMIDLAKSSANEIHAANAALSERREKPENDACPLQAVPTT